MCPRGQRRRTVETVRVLHVDGDPAFLDLAATLVERADRRIDVATVTAVAEARGWPVAVAESVAGGVCFELTGVEFVDREAA